MGRAFESRRNHTASSGSRPGRLSSYRCLKDLCEICGFNKTYTITCYRNGTRYDEVYPKYELIGTHTGRKTFICFALSNGVPPDVVMKFTGHCDYKSMKPYIDISEVFFKSGLMEAWGRGIPDIFDLCKENGLPKPEFELANGFVYLTIRFKQSLTPYLSGGVNDGERGGVNALGESLKQVYDLIHGNPGIKANQIAERLGRSINTIEKQLSRLKEKSQIEYRGSAKTGGYYAK